MTLNKLHIWCRFGIHHIFHRAFYFNEDDCLCSFWSTVVLSHYIGSDLTHYCQCIHKCCVCSTVPLCLYGFFYRRESIFGFWIVFPSHKIIMLLLYNLCCKPCPMHECLAGKCKAQLGPIMCPSSHEWCMVRTGPPLTLVDICSWPT